VCTPCTPRGAAHRLANRRAENGVARLCGDPLAAAHDTERLCELATPTCLPAALAKPAQPATATDRARLHLTDQLERSGSFGVLIQVLPELDDSDVLAG
jgi:hypothetical protein